MTKMRSRLGLGPCHSLIKNYFVVKPLKNLFVVKSALFDKRCCSNILDKLAS